MSGLPYDDEDLPSEQEEDEGYPIEDGEEDSESGSDEPEEDSDDSDASSEGDEEDSSEQAARDWLNDDDEADDPRNQRGVARQSQSYVAWNMEHNSPIVNQFNTFDTGRIDPYKSADKYLQEVITSVYTTRDAEVSQKQDAISRLSESGFTKYGSSVHLTGTGIYNRTVRNTAYGVSSSESVELYKPPRGLVTRPDAKDWNVFQEEHKTYGMREAVYQLQDASYVGGLMGRTGKTEVLTQGFTPITVTKDGVPDEAASLQATKTAAKVLGGNEVSIQALARAGVSAGRVTFDTKGEAISPQFHVKLSYFYSEGSDGKRFFQAGTIGSQNRTESIQNKNSLESVVFLSMDMVSHKNEETKAKMQEVLREIAAATDAMFTLQNRGLDAEQSRSSVEEYFTQAVPQSKFLSINKDIHTKRLSRLNELSQDGSKSKVIVSLQFLETTLFSSTRGPRATPDDAEFTAYKKDLFHTLESLSSQGRLTLMMSGGSINGSEGLYALYDRLNDDRQVFDLFGDEDSAATKTRIRQILKESVSITATRLQHDKGFVVLNEEMTAFKGMEVTSANLSYNSFTRSIEAGIYLGEEEIEEFGMNAKDNLTYYRGVVAKMGNRGLYMEEKGDPTQVAKAKEMLRAMGGVESRSFATAKNAPFRFSTRYDASGKATGLDIATKNAFNFSVTISSTKEARYNVKTGETEIKEVPILYINKGNRVIVGMEWMNKSDRNVVVTSTAYDSHSGNRKTVLRPGESAGVDATQVLGSIIYTMSQGLEYEENRRVMYLGLKALLEQGDAATLKALAKSGITGESARQEMNVMKDIVNAKNINEIANRSDKYGKIISQNAVAQQTYKREMNAVKGALYKQITEIYPQSHELSYSHGQLLWKRPIYGLTADVAEIHYGNLTAESIVSPAFLLSDLPIDHTESLMDSQGLPFIRGVADSKRPSTQEMDKMLGGIIKAEGGVSTPYSMQLMNSMPGLALISYADYQTRLRAMGMDPDSGIGRALLENVFALERRRMEEEEEGSWEANRYRAVMIYTPFEKTEQNVQRLKNLKSIRNFLPGSKEFVEYLRSLGTRNPEFQAKVEAARAGNSDMLASDLLGGIVPFSMPAAQYEEFKSFMSSNPSEEEYMRFVKERALDTDAATQGFLNAPRWVMAIAGINALNDFSYLNTAYANREFGYVKTYRTQSPISTSEMNMTAQEYSAQIGERVKVGTMFVARDVRMDSKPELDRARAQIIAKVNENLQRLGYNNKTYDNATDNEIRLAVKQMKDEARLNPNGEYAFMAGVDIKQGEIKLKKGVYRIDKFEDGWLKKIGRLDEGENAFFLDDVIRYTSLGTKAKAQPLRVKADAFSGRERDTISFVFKSPVVSVQDARNNMATVSFEMISLGDLKTGQRTSQAKGPFEGKAEEYFQTMKNIYLHEVGEDNNAIPTRITGEDVFAVINMGQMKGFVFEAGFGFLRQGENSYTWNALKGEDAGYRVAEALALMMLGDTQDGAGGPKVADLLKQVYAEGRIDKRRQAAAVLDRYAGKAKTLPKKGGATQTQYEFSSTIALYEGLMSLADPTQLKEGIGVEYALVNTVMSALEAGPAGDEARRQLAEKARTMLERTRDTYATPLATASGTQYTYNETKGRSASVLAFFLNVSKDLMTDVDTQYRLAQGGLSELGFTTEGFLEKARADSQGLATITTELDAWFAERTEYFRQRVNSTIDWSLVFEQHKLDILNYLRSPHERKTVVELLEQVSALPATEIGATATQSSLVEFIEKLAIDHGGISAREWFLMEGSEYGGKYRREAELFREAYGRQAYALGIKVPDYARIQELLKTRQGRDSVELQRLEDELDYSLYMMRGLSQFAQGVSLPFDMTINKITVPTGMEDTTALEGHYANALTQSQLNLYTYSSSEKEKATTLQQTLVVLGSMLQEGLGSTLDQSNVSKLYSIKRVNAATLGISSFAEENESEPGITAAERQARRERNERRRQALEAATRVKESTYFTTEFSQTYGFFTARGRENIFPSSAAPYRTKDLPVAEVLFHNFVRGDTSQYSEALEQMKWVREVAVGKTNLSIEERAEIVTRDYLHRLKNNQTIVGGQVQTVLQGVVDASLTEISRLQETEKHLFINPSNDRSRDREIQEWAGRFSPNSVDRAKAFLEEAGITVDQNATQDDVAKLIVDNREALRNNLSAVQKMEFASLGFTAMNVVLEQTSGSLTESDLRDVSMADKRLAFVQLLLKEKVKTRIEGSHGTISLGEAIAAVSSEITAAATISQRVGLFINTSNESQQTLLKSIVRNELFTKLNRAIAIDPGKEYIEGRQQLRKYARGFLQTGRGTQDEQARARSLLESVERTYSVSIPVLDIVRDMDDQGNHTLRFSPEKEVEGWVLGLDVLERLSLVFPGHTHEALRAQYGLVDAMSRAQETGLYEALARAAQSGQDVSLSNEQYGVYQDLASSAAIAKGHILELAKNKETFRKTMADRLSMTGASFIGVNSFLVRQHEVAIGTRADTLVKDQTGSGLRSLLSSMAANLNYLHRRHIDAQEEGLVADIQRVSSEAQDLRRQAWDTESRLSFLLKQQSLPPEVQAELITTNLAEQTRLHAEADAAYAHAEDLRHQNINLRGSLFVDTTALDATDTGRELKSYAMMMEKVMTDISKVVGHQGGYRYQDLISSVTTPNDPQAPVERERLYTERAALNRQIFKIQGQSSVKDTLLLQRGVVEDRLREIGWDNARYLDTKTYTDSLLSSLGGEPNNQASLRELERVLFRSAVLVNRQGAPSGTFHAFGIGHQAITIETVKRSSQLFGSVLGPELKASNTSLLMSAMGNQFVELGDYDGDSFQAAFTRISDVSREVTEANMTLLKARREYYSMEDTGIGTEAVTASLEAKRQQSMEALERSVKDFMDKMQALHSLSYELAERSNQKIRDYVVDFMGLPRQFLDEGPTSIGAIQNEHLSSLFKQYRDTAANFYGNRDKIEALLTPALAAAQEINLVDVQGRRKVQFNIPAHPELPQEMQTMYVNTLDKVSKDFIAYSTDEEIAEFEGLDRKGKSKKLIEFSALMSQKMAALSGVDKVTAKVAGSLLNSAAFRNVQAIVGATGTGLLGKTYNTVVPLLGLAVSQLSNIRAMEESSRGADVLGQTMTSALTAQIAKLRTTLPTLTEEAEREKVERQLELTKSLLRRQQRKELVPYEIEIEESKANLNAMFGMALDIQQFLRDAALKPKKGTSVALAAADFEYQVSYEDGSKKTIKGLDRILDEVDETGRTDVMTRFIGTRAANVLAADYGFTYTPEGRVEVGQQQLDSSELRAFALLEMMNEFLSGKYTGAEMMKKSVFAGFLRQRKEVMSERAREQGAIVDVNDEYVVQSTLADGLAKFRADYVYNSMLEAEDYKDMLSEFRRKIDAGYTDESINRRSEAYQQQLTDAYSRQFKGQPLSQEVQADIDRRTREWRLQEENYRDVMQAAKERARAQNANVSYDDETAEIFKAVQEYQMQRQTQDFVGEEGKAGIFDSLISLNKVVSGLQKDEFETPGTPEQYRIAQTAILYNISRGKLEGTTLNESVFRLAEEVKKSGSSAEAVGALLAVGGATSMPGLMEFITEQAAAQAGDDTSRKDALIRESLEALGDILTTKVPVAPGSEQSVADIIAEKSVVSASSAQLQSEISEIALRQSELNERRAATVESGQVSTEIDTTLDLLSNMRTNLEQRLQEVQESPQAAVQELNQNLNVMENALNDINGQIDTKIEANLRNRVQREQSKAYVQAQSVLRQASTSQSVASLLTVPLFFAALQDDTPVTERVAELIRNTLESTLTLSTNQESVTRRLLLNEGSGAAIAASVSGGQVPSSLQSTSYVEEEQLAAERTTGRANYLLQVARAREFMFQSNGRLEGLGQAIAFEALNTTGSYLASRAAQSTTILRDESLTTRSAIEIMGGVVGMALANVITQRPIAGTDFTYDQAFAATMQSLASIRDGILAASQQALAEAVNGADIDITDGYTGETLDAIVNEGDFSSPDDNTSVSALERVLMTEGMLEGEEAMDVESE